jgi:long-chain acyl-CoA synthetase
MIHPGEQHYPEGVRWDAPLPRLTLPALLADAALKFKERVAIEFRDRPISYPDLLTMTDSAAAAFLRAGYGRNHSVALFLGNTPDHPVNFFGALKAGARVVHLSALDGEIALSHKLTDSEARILVTSNLATLLPMALKFLDCGLLDRLIVCEDVHWGDVGNATLPLPADLRVISYADFIAEAAPPAAWPAINVDDVAVLQYTGGTTGLPKGAMLTHGNLMAAAHQFNLWGQPLRIERGDRAERVICVLPLFHIYALLVILIRAIEVGDTISLHQRFDVAGVLRDIEQKRATVFPGVPTMWIAIANLPDIDSRDLSSLAVAGSGGAPLPVEIAGLFERKTGLALKSGWGMTETCGAGTSHPRGGPHKPGSIGLAMSGIEMDVVSAEDPSKVLADGESGEIRIRGPNVTRGYWNRPQESAASFVGDFFLTGDIGYRDSDGYFFLVDRKKDMIISGGFNVYPQMIEQAIYTHPAVQEVIVIGIPDSYRGEAAKAFVTLKAGAEPFTVEDLRAFLAGKLGKHELPTALDFVAELPRTPVGKLSRHELRAQQRA